MNEGYYAAVNMLGLSVPHQNVYYESFDMYNNNFQVIGHGCPYDKISFLGDPKSLDFMALYSENGTVNKVMATQSRANDLNILREAMKQGEMPKLGQLLKIENIFESTKAKLRVNPPPS